MNVTNSLVEFTTFNIKGHDHLHRFLFIIIFELPWRLGKDNGVVHRLLLHEFEFRKVLLKEWLPSNTGNPKFEP